MKFNKILATYLFTFIILIGLANYVLDRTKSEIYFNMWLNQIVAKSASGNLLITRDTEDFIMDNYTVGKTVINLDHTSTRVRYDKKTKSLNIFLMIPKVENNTLSYFSFKDIPNDISKKICEGVEKKALYGSLSNQFTINGEEVLPNRFNSFVNTMGCYFLSDDPETYVLAESGGWIFRINGGNEQPTEINSE